MAPPPEASFASARRRYRGPNHVFWLTRMLYFFIKFWLVSHPTFFTWKFSKMSKIKWNLKSDLKLYTSSRFLNFQIIQVKFFKFQMSSKVETTSFFQKNNKVIRINGSAPLQGLFLLTLTLLVVHRADYSLNLKNFPENRTHFTKLKITSTT